MRLNLEQYQKEAITFMRYRDYAVLDGAIGAGKTVIALSLIDYFVSNFLAFKVLILAPPDVVNTVYEQEVQKWDKFKYLTVTKLHGPNKHEKIYNDSVIYLATYDVGTLTWLFTHEHCPEFDMFIFDESHNVKNSSSKRFKLLKSVAPYFKYRYLMTGTLIGNKHEDLWAQYYLADLGKRLFPSMNRFRTKWCYQISRYNWRIRSKQDAYEVTRRVADITFEIDQSLIELPAISKKVIPVELPSDVLHTYRTMEADSFVEIEGTVVTATSLQIKFQKCQQLTSGFIYKQLTPKEKVALTVHDFKIRKLREIVDKVDEPIMVVANFKEEFAMLAREFPDIVMINGDSSLKGRKAAIAAWNEGRIPLLAIQPFSAGEGVNLQAAGRIQIWYSLCWSSLKFRQVIGRLFRKGQKRDVLIRILSVKGTVDELMLEALKRHARTSVEFSRVIKQYRRRYKV